MQAWKMYRFMFSSEIKSVLISVIHLFRWRKGLMWMTKHVLQIYIFFYEKLEQELIKEWIYSL